VVSPRVQAWLAGAEPGQGAQDCSRDRQGWPGHCGRVTGPPPARLCGQEQVPSCPEPRHEEPERLCPQLFNSELNCPSGAGASHYLGEKSHFSSHGQQHPQNINF